MSVAELSRTGHGIGDDERHSRTGQGVVRLDYQDPFAHICVSAWPRMAKRMERLYGPGLDHDTDDCARRWEVPIQAVSFHKAVATPKRVISDERLAALKAGRARIRGRVPVPVSAVHTNDVPRLPKPNSESRVFGTAIFGQAPLSSGTLLFP